MIKVFCNLKELMDIKEINITELQKETSLSRTTISNLINHHSGGIQFETFETLCEALNCDTGDLFVRHNIDLKFIDREINVYKLSDDEKGITELMELDLECKFSFDSKKHDLNFKVESTFCYNEDYYDIQKLIPSGLFDHFLTQSNFPHYIKIFLDKELSTFIRMKVMKYIYEK